MLILHALLLTFATHDDVAELLNSVDVGFPPLAQEISSPEFVNYTDALNRCVWKQPAGYAAVSTIHWFSYKLSTNNVGGPFLDPMPIMPYVPSAGLYTACNIMSGSFCYGVNRVAVVGSVCVWPSCTEADLNMLLENVFRPLYAKKTILDPTNLAATIKDFKCHLEDPKFEDDKNAHGVVALLVLIGLTSFLCMAVCRVYEARDMIAKIFKRGGDSSGSDTTSDSENAVYMTPIDADTRQPIVSEPKVKQPPYIIRLCYCWDLFSSISEMMAVSDRPTNFLNMWRVVSNVWIIYLHAGPMPDEIGMENYQDFYAYEKSFANYFNASGQYAVDTFFFMSAFLLAMIGTRSWPREARAGVQAKRVGMSYVDRYVRIVPTYGVCLLAAYYLYMYILSGPFLRLGMHGGVYGQSCGDKWWKNLLFVNNFGITGGLCLAHTWYLACDFQLMIVGVLLVLGYVHWSRLTVILIAVLVVVSLIVCFFTTKDSGDQYGGGLDAYVKPWNRAPPYLYGLLTGFAYTSKVNEKVKSFMNNHAWRWLGYFVSAGIMIVCCYIQFRAVVDLYKGDIWSPRRIGWSQVAYHLLWGFPLVFLTLSFVNGHGGWVKDMMAHPVWEPLSKLTFSAYLVHGMMLGLLKLTYSPNLIHFSNWWLTFCTGMVTVSSYATAAVFFVFVERPVAATWSLVSGRSLRRVGSK